MKIVLTDSYDVQLSTALLGYVGETNARPVTVEGLTVDGADRYVLTIDYGDGVTYEVDITGGIWTPTADILRSAQTVSCQIAAKKLSGQEYILLKKSRIFRLRIGAAIGDNAVPSPDVAMDALDKIDAIGRQAHADMQTAVTAAETATTAAESAKKSATAAGVSADTATQAASRAETAQASAETSATQAETAMQDADTARQQAVTQANAAKISADIAAAAAQQTTADKTATAGYAETAKTCADSTATDRQAVADMTVQVTADKATVAENAAQVATDRKAAETAAQTALENDRLYEGTNLAEKFKDEIANYSDIWQWIKARIKAGNFAGIHVNDFIRWQTTDNKWIESRVAGINIYRRYGDREVSNHIDFISKDLWPTLHVMNPVNYNNGIIPTENLSGNGTKTAFVLTNEMAAVASVTIGGTATTAYTYDADTHTITFTAAPAAGTNNIVVTGTGSEYPWLASDLYLYANSLKGHVAGGASKTSPVKLVDYTKDGIWSKLPEALKSVIVTKRALLPQRYSASGVLSNNNSWGWQDMGKLWIPSEIEVYGHGVWADNSWDKGGFVQYPIFNCNMRCVKGLGDGGGRNAWWLISAHAGNTNNFCHVSYNGSANANIAFYTWVGLPVCFRIA